MSYVHTYAVKGTVYQFPIDMLRYDNSIPMSEYDAATIASTFHVGRIRRDEEIEISLKHHSDSKSWQPTSGRWESFGWKVISHGVRKS